MGPKNFQDFREAGPMGTIQTAYWRPFVYLSCYFHYQVLTVSRVIQANYSESLQFTWPEHHLVEPD